MNTKTDTIRRIAAQTIAGAATVTRRTAMLIALLTMTTTVSAQVVTTVSTWSDLYNQLRQTGENAPDVIQLTANVIDNQINELEVPSGRTVTLDLNGHTVKINSSVFMIAGNLTVQDTSIDGSGNIIGACSNSLYIGYGSNFGTLTLESGKISGDGSVITVMAGSSLIINGGEVSATDYYSIFNRGNCVMNGGVVSAPDYVIMNRNRFVLNDGMVHATGTGDKAIGILSLKNSEVTIHDGTVTAYNPAIMGYYATSGSYDGTNAKFTVEGGTVTSTNGTAILAPQPSGEVTITGGTITGARSGVFLRSGTLNIQGGTITGNTQSYDTNNADYGVIGSAVYVAQNENKLDIDVNISGGTLIGYLPLSENNPNNNTEEDLKKINYAITGGLFHSTGTETIRIEDYQNGPFIAGGRFTHSVDQYVANGYFQFQDSNTDPYYVCLPYLADGMNYLQTSDTDVDVATYTKSLGANRVNKRQGWLVPFDYTITQDDEALFTFYKINMIANSPSPDVATSNDIWVFLTKLNEGDVLHANMPYVYKPKQEVTDYPFTSNNVTLKAKNTGVIAKAETLEDVYSFYGTYENTTPTASDPFYYVNIDGNLSLGNNGSVTVGPYRWILRKTSKYGSTPSYVRDIHFFDGEDEATSISEELRVKSEESADWFTLDGRKLVGKPTKSGMYVVGGKKVVIK